MSRSTVTHHALRAGLLVLAGSALIAVPFLLGLDAAPLVAGVIVGALTIALGLLVSAALFALAGLAALITTSVTRYSAGTA